MRETKVEGADERDRWEADRRWRQKKEEEGGEGRRRG